MSRVNIRYQDGTTVDANNLGDALVHLMAQGLNGVEDVVEEPVRELCKHCGGTGLADPPPPKRLLTCKQAEDKVADINKTAPPAEHSFDERVKVARAAAE